MTHRRSLCMLMLSVLPAMLSAQAFSPAFPSFDETLLSIGDVEHGGFGGPVVKITSINGEVGVLAGGRGGWIINHTFCIGGGGYGLMTDVPALVVGPDAQRYVEFNYGGLELEKIFDSDRLMHLSVNLLIGGGSVGFRHTFTNNSSSNGFAGMSDSDYHERDAFFVMEPAVNMDLNVTAWFRLSGGVSYRFIRGASSRASTNADLSAPSAVLTFRFGKF